MGDQPLLPLMTWLKEDVKDLKFARCALNGKFVIPGLGVRKNGRGKIYKFHETPICHVRPFWCLGTLPKYVTERLGKGLPPTPLMC